MAKQIILHQYRTEIGGIKIATNAIIKKETPKAYLVNQVTKFGAGEAADSLLQRINYEVGGVHDRTFLIEQWIPASQVIQITENEDGTGAVIALECQEWLAREKPFIFFDDVH